MHPELLLHPLVGYTTGGELHPALKNSGAKVAFSGYLRKGLPNISRYLAIFSSAVG